MAFDVSRSERSTGRHSEDRRLSGLVPEVSLAARAGSLGATSLQTPYRFQGITCLDWDQALSRMLHQPLLDITAMQAAILQFA